MPNPSGWRTVLGPLALIAACVALSAGAFAYTAGWLTPNRLSPADLLAALAPEKGPALGHRRNHAKGICFTGVFEASGEGTRLSRAPMLAAGSYPALGRLNLAGPNPEAADATARVRGIGLQIRTDSGSTWRMAMIDPPVFPVATAEAFAELQSAAKNPDQAAMGAFVAAHPDFAPFRAWAGSAPFTASYAENAFNSLNSFVFTDAAGKASVVRWSLVPEAQVQPIDHEALAALGPNHLDEEITARVAEGPVRWRLVVTVAGEGDPTADPTKAWPADRPTVDVGTLVVQRIEQEADGPCRDINFDPTILPDGMGVSDDPLPAARSATYARSFDLRTAEAADYPREPRSAR